MTDRFNTANGQIVSQLFRSWLMRVGGQPHLIRRQALRQFRGEAMHIWNEAVAA
jgi:hypothetical protein